MEYHIFNNKNRIKNKTPLHVEKGLFSSSGEGGYPLSSL
jgi:hypothetical protein